MKHDAINWISFSCITSEYEGITAKFEDLCRQLFNYAFNSTGQELHSNPNNPGLETDPIFDKKQKKRVGFQAKFFENKVDYDNIYASAENIVKYYNRKVDKVYLYSNKSVSVTAKKYVKAKELLQKAGIELVCVTDREILDKVRIYPILSQYYFGDKQITYEWIKKYNELIFEELDERFNSKFNVETIYSNNLSVFVLDNNAIKKINNKKIELLEAANKLNLKVFRKYTESICEYLKHLSDVSHSNFSDSFKWKDLLIEYLEKETSTLKKEKEKLQQSLDSLIKKEEVKKSINYNYQYEYRKLLEEINTIDEAIDLPNKLNISEQDKMLVKSKILLVSGVAGTGKTQLFANECYRLLTENEYALLILSGDLFDNSHFDNQIKTILHSELDFYEIIDQLDFIGKKRQRIVPIFIDALNEVCEKQLWKPFLIYLIDKINECSNVKLALSIRTEYKETILGNLIHENILNGFAVEINHEGFRYDNIKAIREFFKYYNITFTPLNALMPEMDNPLFLMLYGKTYSKGEIDLEFLYSKLISQAYNRIYISQKQQLLSQGYDESINILTDLIEELVVYFVDNKIRYIVKNDFFKLQFWKNYNISPPSFISALQREHIIINYRMNDEDVYAFVYDQMNDYFCAKTIVRRANSLIELKQEIIDELLCINDSIINKFDNMNIFCYIGLFAKRKFRCELFDIFDIIKPGDDLDYIKYIYMKSYAWRPKDALDPKDFMYFYSQRNLTKYFWEVLIINSIKTDHPLNAEFLHHLLFKYQLNELDYYWTIHINSIFNDSDNRVTQILNSIVNREKYFFTCTKQLELLLTLFSWFLSSSCRGFRDFTSIAMVELLTNNLDMCLLILKKFENVKDPYIYQRLFGIVFGAYSKSNNVDYSSSQKLAEYTFSSVFDKKDVYPDILLRDYARLIVEKFLFDNKNYNGVIDRKKIFPIYNSAPIPRVNNQNATNRGLELVISSMKFNINMDYGDFGRYVFQSALSSFKVDLRYIFNYSIYFIINELGYNGSFFSQYDINVKYNRYDYEYKIERIGKKYQRIAMYNILARVSDHYALSDEFLMYDINGKFLGPWNPFLRDFDPTLNLIKYDSVPIFSFLDDFTSLSESENFEHVSVTNWIKKEGNFIKNIQKAVLLTDNSEQIWVSFSQFLSTSYDNYNFSNRIQKAALYAFFVNFEQFEKLLSNLKNNISFSNFDSISLIDTYTLFNREYPWSVACNEIKDRVLIDASIRTGKKIIKTIDFPNISFTSDSPLFLQNEDSKNVHQEQEELVDIGKFLSPSLYMTWENNVDASKNTTISRFVPCPELINFFNLSQKNSDCFYFDKNGCLAAFDTNFTQKRGGLVLRKDLLEEFLQNKKFKLVWIASCSKEAKFRNNNKFCQWSGMFYYENGKVEGNLFKL